MENRKVVSRDEWLVARTAASAPGKGIHPSARPAQPSSGASCRGRPSTKSTCSTGRRGKETLPELFDGRSQLIVYHFMFGPDWKAGCPHCSFWADNFNGNVVHLNQRDVTLVAVSRAPYAKLAAYEKRMGWTFKWVSSGGTDFNFDYQASFTPEEVAAKKALYNYRDSGSGRLGARRCQRVLQGRGGQRVPHLFDLCARHRHAEHGVPLSGHHAEGAR